MKITLYCLLVTVFLVLGGCSGHLYTTLNPKTKGATSTTEVQLKGILVYPVLNVIELYETTVLINPITKVIEAKKPNCVPTRQAKFATRADYSNPYQLRYEPGVFETNTFGVTLTNGVLAAVNTSSDPSKSATATAALLPFVTAPKVASADIGKKFCNTQPKLLGVYEAPGVQPYDSIPP
jgi:hypothetical protein